MILYALQCDAGHGFEAWFRDSASFDEQVEAGVLTCPVCDSDRVSKAIMAPRLARHHGARDGDASPVADPAPHESPGAAGVSPVAAPAPAAADAPSLHKADDDMGRALRALRRAVEATCDDVGPRFAEEARRIHYGETAPRGIFGRTSDGEAEALREEGIAFASIPWLRRGDA